ncbi:hypothetical protein J5681_06830 [bacterium]|nr:hypothetical protein [bacterium]
MTVEQIDKQIEELREKKKAELKKQRQKAQAEQRQKNARKRKLESRVKYIVGGYVLSVQPDYIDRLINSDKLREQDRKTLIDYKKNL